jgi:hypothetical protein
MANTFKFRILRGNHSEGKYPEGHPWAGRSIIYEIGEIVESRTNLARHNAEGPMGPKFQRIYDATPATDKAKQALDIARQREAAETYDDGNGPQAPVQTAPEDDLDSMSIQDLRKLAKEGGVQLPGNCSQADAIRAIRGAPVTA